MQLKRLLIIGSRVLFVASVAGTALLPMFFEAMGLQVEFPFGQVAVVILVSAIGVMLGTPSIFSAQAYRRRFRSVSRATRSPSPRK